MNIFEAGISYYKAPTQVSSVNHVSKDVDVPSLEPFSERLAQVLSNVGCYVNTHLVRQSGHAHWPTETCGQ